MSVNTANPPPPPPTGVGLYARAPEAASGSAAAPSVRRSRPEEPRPVPDEQAVDEPKRRPTPSPAPSDALAGRPFDAELDVAELDERERPGSTWRVRATRLSRSEISFLSRRMCYTGRWIVMAVHMIDAEPVPLFGRVRTCDYEGDGRYRVEASLAPIPENRSLAAWLSTRAV